MHKDDYMFSMENAKRAVSSEKFQSNFPRKTFDLLNKKSMLVVCKG